MFVSPMCARCVIFEVFHRVPNLGLVMFHCQAVVCNIMYTSVMVSNMTHGSSFVMMPGCGFWNGTCVGGFGFGLAFAFGLTAGPSTGPAGSSGFCVCSSLSSAQSLVVGASGHGPCVFFRRVSSTSCIWRRFVACLLREVDLRRELWFTFIGLSGVEMYTGASVGF